MNAQKTWKLEKKAKGATLVLTNTNKFKRSSLPIAKPIYINPVTNMPYDI